MTLDDVKELFSAAVRASHELTADEQDILGTWLYTALFGALGSREVCQATLRAVKEERERARMMEGCWGI